MFRLRRLSEDDTIFLLQCISSECISRSLLAQGPVFVYSKRHPYKYLHECLSTIINMVLSVQVYYYKIKKNYNA